MASQRRNAHRFIAAGKPLPQVKLFGQLVLVTLIHARWASASVTTSARQAATLALHAIFFGNSKQLLLSPHSGIDHIF